MDNRDGYVENLKAQLDQWNSQVAAWEAATRGATAEVKLELEKQVANTFTEKALANLSQMAGVVEGACSDVRESILCLKTRVSDEKGLVAAVRDYVPRYREQSGLRCELIADGGVDLHLSPLAEVQLLRIVQEALTNARKHAQASNVWVVIERHGGETVVSVQDDGKGFELDQVLRRGGHRFGLSIMGERAEEIDGILSIDTAPGKGTRVAVHLVHGENGG